MYADDNLVESYFSILKQKLSEDGIPHISYDLATEDSESYVPGILAWPKIFIITKEEHQNLVNKVNSMNTFDGFDEKDSPRHSPLYAIVRNANINPLILDKDTSLEVKGDLVQKMSNLLLTYSAKHKSRSNNDDD